MAFHCDIELAVRLTDELPLLASVLGGSFHMDSYLSSDGQEHVNDDEVFDEAISLRDIAERERLVSDIAALLLKDDDAVVSFWNRHAFCHNYNYEDAAEARDFLARFQRRLARHHAA